MKYIILSLLLILVVETNAQDTTDVDLPSAVEQGDVEISTHAKGRRLRLQIKIWNKLKKVLRLEVPPGLHFRSKDPKAQDLLTVDDMSISIPAQKSILIDMQGFCMQHYHYGPSDKDIYYFDGFAPSPLKILADSLAEYPSLSREYKQMFVWAISDSKPMVFKEVYVDPLLEEDTRNIVNYVSRISGLAPVQVIAISSPDQKPKLALFMQKGVLSFQNSSPRIVSFGLYDENDSLMHYYYRNRRLKPGIFHYAFGVNEAIYEDKPPVYYVKVVDSSGEIVAEMQVDENTEMIYKETVPLSFNMRFSLDQSVHYVKLNLYQPDGTLVQELSRYKLLEAGEYDFNVETEHIFEKGTTFTVKLVDRYGNVYHQQKVQ